MFQGAKSFNAGFVCIRDYEVLSVTYQNINRHAIDYLPVLIIVCAIVSIL